MNRIAIIVMVALIVSLGCERSPQLRLESRTHGFDFVDEHGTILATAKTLADIGPTLGQPVISSKLKCAKLSVHFYHVSRGLKGFQVPKGVTCRDIVDTLEAELAAHGKPEFELNYDDW